VDHQDQQVKELLTDSEWETFQASLPDNVDELDDRRLAAELARGRQTRDKYRDLYRRQATSSRTRRRSRGEALVDNERTSRKAQIFEAAVERFEEAVAARQAG
jgi:hypothetical protein